MPGCETLSKVCGVWDGYSGDSEIVIIIIIIIIIEYIYRAYFCRMPQVLMPV